MIKSTELSSPTALDRPCPALKENYNPDDHYNWLQERLMPVQKLEWERTKDMVDAMVEEIASLRLEIEETKRKHYEAMANKLVHVSDAAFHEGFNRGWDMGFDECMAAHESVMKGSK